MTWNNLPNLAHAQQVNESHLDQIRENIEHLGAMGLAGVAFNALATGTYGARITVGKYTGNGAATQEITVGFQPKLVITLPNASGYFQWIKTSSDTTKSHVFGNTGLYEDDHIISLNANSFTVGDGTGSAGNPANSCNPTGIVITYIAIG